MSTTEAALTPHVVLNRSVCDDALLAATAKELHDKFGIEDTRFRSNWVTRLIRVDVDWPKRCEYSYYSPERVIGRT